MRENRVLLQPGVAQTGRRSGRREEIPLHVPPTPSGRPSTAGVQCGLPPPVYGFVFGKSRVKEAASSG